MKTLNFRKVNFGPQDVLSQLQMKRIIGGHSTTLCVSAGNPCGPNGATCDGKEYATGGSDNGCCCGDDRYDSDCDAA